MSACGSARFPDSAVFWVCRFSSPVCVSSVHVRASSVLRLVVQPGEKVSGSGGVGGKAVTVPADSSNGIDIRHGGATSEASTQDIDVDVRGEPR